MLYWNVGAEAIFQYTSDEAIGRAIDDLLVPTDRRADEKRAEETLRSGSTTYEFLRRRKDGSLIYVDVSNKVIRDPAFEAPLILCTKKT